MPPTRRPGASEEPTDVERKLEEVQVPDQVQRDPAEVGRRPRDDRPRDAGRHQSTAQAVVIATASAPATPAVPVVVAPAAAPIAAHIETAHKAEADHKIEAANKSEATQETVAAVATETPEAVTSLCHGLRDYDADRARDAAVSLGHVRHASAVQPLIEALTNADGFTHPVVRAAAAASLGQLGNRRAVDALIVATTDSMAEASAEAIRSLGLLGDPRAVAPLVDILRNADGFFVGSTRRAALLALATLGGPEAAAALSEVAANQLEDPTLRNDAQSTIAEHMGISG